MVDDVQGEPGFGGMSRRSRGPTTGDCRAGHTHAGVVGVESRKKDNNSGWSKSSKSTKVPNCEQLKSSTGEPQGKRRRGVFTKKKKGKERGGERVDAADKRGPPSPGQSNPRRQPGTRRQQADQPTEIHRRTQRRAPDVSQCRGSSSDILSVCKCLA